MSLRKWLTDPLRRSLIELSQLTRNINAVRASYFDTDTYILADNRLEAPLLRMSITAERNSLVCSSPSPLVQLRRPVTTVELR